jgi:hypothetical protein
MNKKLFSWKALAGLALLVAMGMTSCKNTTEVDPNDPYNTQKPVKPGTSTAGDADLTFTITNASGGDAVSLWNAWKKNNADAAKELMAEEEITIALDFSNYKLDGKTIALPQFLTTPNGSVINLIVSGFAEAKKPFKLDLKNKSFAGAEVNITLLATDFDMDLDARGTKTTLGGAATLTTLTAKADNSKKNALTIDETVTVSGIDLKEGAIKGSADNIIAKLVSGTEGLVEGKGAIVGDKDNGAVYAKNLIATADVTVNGGDKAALESVVLAEGVTMTLGAAKSQIESIVGLGTEKKPTKVNLKGDADDLSKIGGATNVTLSGNATTVTGAIVPTKIADASVFEDCEFDMAVDLYSGASNAKFKKAVRLYVEDIATINFANVDFAKTATLRLYGTETISTTSLVKMFQWDKAGQDYLPVKDDDEDNLTAANAKNEGVDYVQTTYTSWTRITGAGITTGMKDGKFFHFTTIEKAEAALKKSKEAYDKLVAKNGTAGLAASNKSAEYNTYKADWEALYGTQNQFKDPIHNAKGEDQVASFTAYTDQEIWDGKTDDGAIGWNAAYNGLYRDYADEWAFVTGANAKIDGSDWFTISYAATSTVVPEAVDLIFDGDCTYGGKALSANALNSLITGWSPGFTSVKDAWFYVTYDGETYEWKRTTGGYLLQ